MSQPESSSHSTRPELFEETQARLAAEDIERIERSRRREGALLTAGVVLFALTLASAAALVYSGRSHIGAPLALAALLLITFPIPSGGTRYRDLSPGQALTTFRVPLVILALYLLGQALA